VIQDYEGQKFFDHCVCPGGYVLNAHLLATLGLFDLSNRSRYARRLYRTGIRTAQEMLPLYDHDPVAYDLTHLTVRKGEGVNATRPYEEIVLAALQALDSTKPRFVYWRSRWAAD
jgi:D-glucuronyl C5-epimerase-like protein